MFSVKVRDSIMIAHSLPNPFFGPAQNLHGATYVVDVEFSSAQLDSHNVVLDIGAAKSVLKTVLDKLRYQNLDAMPEFEGQLTTTEFVAHYIHSSVSKEISHSFSGGLKVTLGETHDAWASYEAPVTAQ